MADAIPSGFWSLPVKMVKLGRWADLWRMGKATGSVGAASSLLPVLAQFSWPERHRPDGIPWGSWWYLPTLRLSELAGIAKNTVLTGRRTLVASGAIEEVRSSASNRHGGPPRAEFRVHADWLGGAKEPFVKIDGRFLASGWWALLPSAAARHLLITIAALDPVRDPTAFGERLAEGSSELPENFVESERAKSPLGLKALGLYAGMSEHTTIDALRILTRPVWDGIPLVETGLVSGNRGARWLAPARSIDGGLALGEHPFPDGLIRDAQWVRESRRRFWPEPVCSSKHPWSTPAAVAT